MTIITVISWIRLAETRFFRTRIPFSSSWKFTHESKYSTMDSMKISNVCLRIFN